MPVHVWYIHVAMRTANLHRFAHCGITALPPSKTMWSYCFAKPALQMQAIQAEADQQAEKELARFMYRQFNEFTGPTSDSNPLLRPNKLTRTNPLL